jgi:excisionase family DNA binding protein
MAKRLIGIKQTQKKLGDVCRTTVYELIWAGKLRSCKVGSRRMVDEDSADEYIAEILNTQPKAA